jgi:hypothetical protein
MLATKHVTLTDTTLQEIFAIPSGFLAHITYVFIANHGGSTNSIDLYWDDNSVPQVYIFDGTTVTQGDRVTLGNNGGPLFVLHEGETIQAQASGAGNFEVVVTFDLQYNPFGFTNFNQ